MLKLQKPEETSITDFENTPKYSRHEINSALSYLVRCQEFFLPEDYGILQELLPQEDLTEESLDGSIEEMMREQLSCAKSLKSAYFSQNGRLRSKVDPKEARESLRATQQIIDTVFKKQGTVDHYAKMMAMERAILDVIGKMPEKQQLAFTKQLEKSLEQT